MRATGDPLCKVGLAFFHKAITDRAVFTLAEINLLRPGGVFDLATELVNGTVGTVCTECQFIVADDMAQGVLKRALVAKDAPAFLAGQR